MIRERLEQLLPNRRSRVIAGSMTAVAVLVIALMVVLAILPKGDTTTEGVPTAAGTPTGASTPGTAEPAEGGEVPEPTPHLDGPVAEVAQDEVPSPPKSTDTGSKVSAEDRAKALSARDTVTESAPGTVNGKVRPEEGTQAPIYPTGFTSEPVVNTTDTTKGDFGFALGVVAGTSVTASNDQCFVDWAKTALPTKRDVGDLSVQTVCGVPAAVLVGGYGVNGRDLTGRAAEQPAFADVKSLLFGPSTVRYASVATADNKAVMFVVAPA